MTRSKKFTLRDPILTVFNGIEDYTLRIGGLSEKIAKDEFRMTVAIRDTMAKASKVDGGALMSELAVEIGKVSAPMNGGKAIGEAMVNKLLGDKVARFVSIDIDILFIPLRVSRNLKQSIDHLVD